MESYIRLYGPWGEHPGYPIEDWKHEVADDSTRQGYWEWVAARAEAPKPDSASVLRRH